MKVTEINGRLVDLRRAEPKLSEKIAIINKSVKEEDQSRDRDRKRDTKRRDKERSKDDHAENKYKENKSNTKEHCS